MQPANTTQHQLPLFNQPGKAPYLLIDWEPWWPVFLENLADTVLRRAPPPISVTSKPARFWTDVFVDRPIPWHNFGHSALGHGVLLVLVFSTGNFWSSRKPSLADPYKHTSITYHSVSEYLPPLQSAGKIATARKARKGQPELAKQEIISVPPTPDNSTQTIVNPRHPQIFRQEVQLPNLVIATPIPQAPPVASLAQNQITFPLFEVTPVQPAPQTNQLKQRKLNIELSEVAAPALTAESLRQKPQDLTIADSTIDPAAPAPKLELPLQRATLPQNGQNVVPPPPSIQTPGTAREGSGQLMALSVRPVAPTGEIKVPDGSRSGVFAASPTGRAGAPGTPSVEAEPGPPDGSTIANGSSGRSSTEGAGSKPNNGSGAGTPSGITIAGGNLKPGSSAVVGDTLPSSARPLPETPKLVASARPSFNDLGRQPLPPYTPAGERKIEDQVFGSKKSYSMQLNMPNLTSAGGSWVIRFAELREAKDSGDLSTPVAMSKTDPAYPPDLMKDRIEGIVTLYAVIHADGTVGEVKLLHGIHERLDENARVALLKWRFRPATRNGVPVDLEAVVQIPFRASRVRIY